MGQCLWCCHRDSDTSHCENLINVASSLGRCFDVGDVPLMSAVLRRVQGHLSLRVQIHLVSDQNERHELVVFHPYNLLANNNHMHQLYNFYTDPSNVNFVKQQTIQNSLGPKTALFQRDY